MHVIFEKTIRSQGSRIGVASVSFWFTCLTVYPVKVRSCSQCAPTCHHTHDRSGVDVPPHVAHRRLLEALPDRRVVEVGEQQCVQLAHVLVEDLHVLPGLRTVAGSGCSLSSFGYGAL